jgi:hypothetical protein
MKKLASLNYDVTDYLTSGKIDYLVDLTKGRDDLIKNAKVPTLDEMELLPDEQCALVLYHPHLDGPLKKYAMTDKYTTELNLKIFENMLTSLPEQIVKVAAYHFAKAAKYYNLPTSEAIKKYAKEKQITNRVNISEIEYLPPIEKTAETVEFALGKKYPIHTPELVKKAMIYFADHGKRFSPTNAFAYAINVKIAADKMKISYVGTPIEKYANIDAGSLSKNFKAAIYARKGYASEEDKPAYDELIKRASELGPVKVAKVLEELDRKTGVNSQWNQTVLDPIFTTFGEKDRRFVKQGSHNVSMADLKKLGSGIVDDATLTELKGEEGLEVFASLPTPVKNKIIKSIK